jgi:multidrug resistance efflux pump
MATNANNVNSKYGLRPEPVEAKERVHREEKEMKGADAEAQAAARDIEERTEEERKAAANRRQERRQDNIEASDASQENHKTLHEELHPQNGLLDPAGAFVPDAVLPSTVAGAPSKLKKALNDLPNAAGDPRRNDIPPELKV